MSASSPSGTSSGISYPSTPVSTPPYVGVGAPAPAPSGIQLTRDADYLIQSFLPQRESQPRSHLSDLPLPYCTPQISTGFDAPFARGYSTALETVDISQEELLAFIDGLNLAMTASPPLRVVNLAGMVLGLVPYHWAQIAAIAVQTAATAGMRVLSKTLTDRFLRAANLRLFQPRGLSVRICTAEAMQQLVMQTQAAAAPSKLKRFGRGVGSVLMQIPLPITSVVVHAVADKPPTVPAMDPGSFAGSSKKMLATQRRVAALEGYALQLDFNMPKPTKAEGVMDTMASWGVKFDSWREGRKQSKAEERRIELEQIKRQQERGGVGQQQQQGGRASGVQGGLRALLANRRGGLLLRGVGSRMGQGGGYDTSGGGLIGGLGRARLGGRFGRGGGGFGSLRGGNTRALELQVADADLLEHWHSSKVLWVVIMSSEKDKEIEGIDMAESMDDEERVDERTWQTEMGAEREELEFEEELARVAAESGKK